MRAERITGNQKLNEAFWIQVCNSDLNDEFPLTGVPRGSTLDTASFPSFFSAVTNLMTFWGNIGQNSLLWVLSYVTISSLIWFQGDLFASTFLIKNGARVSAATLGAQETPLHLVALYSPKKHSADMMSAMAQIAEALLQAGANPNMQDSKGR